MTKRVLITDSISPAAIDVLRRSVDVDVRLGLTPAQLQSTIGEYEALIVRSETKVTRQVIDSGSKLEIIGRAGVGVDNIDVDAATRRGIFVINSREGNIVSTAEHTIAMLLAAARQIPKANSDLHAGVWNRAVKGIEVRNKVLGIVGLGKVGTTVAEMAKGLRINVIAYDPMVSQTLADKLGVQLVDMGTLLARSDFVSVHVPLNQTTRGLIGAEQIEMMKPTAMLINCARGGIIDEQALYKALETGRLAGAAIDVFTAEPAIGNVLLGSERAVLTPHLAASTSEAETSAGIDVAEQVVSVLGGGPPKSPVNAPAVSPEGMTIVGGYLRAATTLGVIGAQMLAGQAKSITIRYQGEISGHNTDPIKAAVLGGLLESVTDERVNIVNMDIVAGSRGLGIAEERFSTCENYSSMLTVEIEGTSGRVVVAGSSLRDTVYLVRVNDFWFEIEPAGAYLLFTEHKDRPGMIGAVGTIMGNAGINISQMQVSRDLKRGGNAMMVMCIDDPMSLDARQRIQAIPDIYKVHVVKLNG